MIELLTESSSSGEHRSFTLIHTLSAVRLNAAVCFIPQDTETSDASDEESDDEDFQEQRERGEGAEFRRRVEDEEEEEEEMTDLSDFQAPCLPVTRGLLPGTLYKVRFVSGTLLH